MAIAVKVTNVDHSQNQFCVDMTLTLSGNYGTESSHGDTLNLKGVCPSNSAPNRVEVYEAPAAGSARTAYNYTFCPGTTLANGVVQIWTSSAEYSEGTAYSTNFPNAIKARAWFPAL